MKEIGRCFQKCSQQKIVDPNVSRMSQTSCSHEKTDRWKSITTHIRTHTHDIIILGEIVFLRFLRKNVRLLLDFKIRFLRIKCETSLGFELDRL